MRIATVVLALLCTAATASAAPFTWVAQGVFSFVNKNDPNPFAAAFNVGQPFEFTFTMESSAQEGPAYAARPSCGAYNPLLAMTFVSGTVALSATNPPHDYFVYPSSGGGCDISPPGTARLRSTFFQFGQPDRLLAFTFTYFATLPTDALPTDASIITGGDFNFYPMLVPLGGPIDFAYGRLTSIRSVPEPATLSLIGLSLVWLWRRSRRA